jgi:hypothetical protein
MNVNKVLTMNYEKRTLGGLGKNEPKRTQTNPIRQMGKIDAKSVFTKDYEEKCG